MSVRPRRNGFAARPGDPDRWIKAADAPTLIHLKLATDVSTTRTTLSAIREAAFRKRA